MRRGLIGALLVTAGLAGASPTAHAQDRTRPAIASDFVGVFRLLGYPLERQPQILKQPPWTSACQFFGHYPDGYWLHQQSEGGRCANAIPAVKPALPQTVQWRFLRDGLVLIDREDYKIEEVWKVDRVNTASHIGTINLNEGDIIMQLLDRELKQVLWVRLLRRTGHASGP